MTRGCRCFGTRSGCHNEARIIKLREFDRAFESLSRAVDDGSVWTLKVAVVWAVPTKKLVLLENVDLAVLRG